MLQNPISRGEHTIAKAWKHLANIPAFCAWQSANILIPNTSLIPFTTKKKLLFNFEFLSPMGLQRIRGERTATQEKDIFIANRMKIKYRKGTGTAFVKLTH